MIAKHWLKHLKKLKSSEKFLKSWTHTSVGQGPGLLWLGGGVVSAEKPLTSMGCFGFLSLTAGVVLIPVAFSGRGRAICLVGAKLFSHAI